MAEVSEKGPASRATRAVWIAAGIAVVAVYVALFGRYRPENVDDAWTLSWAHNFINHGVETDLVFYNGLGGGVYAFGKLYCVVYGTVLNAVGWTKANGHLVSIALSFVGLLFWGFALRRLGYSRRVCVAFAILLALSEPFFGMANMARVDAWVFLLTAAAFFSFARGYLLLAGLLTTLAIESHPVGCVALFYFAALSLGRMQRPLDGRRLLARLCQLAAGAAFGLVAYVALHYRAFGAVTRSVSYHTQVSMGVPNFFYHYFFKTRYLRHIPELLILSAAIGVHLTGRLWREDRFPLLAVAGVFLFSVLIPRPNFHYTVFAYPAIVLLWVYTSERKRCLTLLIVMMLGLLLPQYALAAYRHRGESATRFEQYVRDVREAVPDDTLMVVGSANEWFAFPDRAFCYYTRFAPGFFYGECYLIEENDLRASGRMKAICRTHTLTRLPNPDLERRGVTVYHAVPK